MVLGTGWLGSAAADRLGNDPSAVVIDPVVVPELMTLDQAASEELSRIVAATGTTRILNACGLTMGSEEDLEAANVAFPRWLCRTLLHTGVRLVHVGSASEYGDPHTAEPIPESHPCRPVGAYATSKARGTDAVLEAREQGLDAVVARVFNIIDRSLPASSPVREWLDALHEQEASGGEIEVWWPPTTRDFVTREDVARALLELSEQGDRPPVVNVCSGIGLTYDEIVHALAGAMGSGATVRSLDRPGIEAVVGDPTVLRDVLGWTPEMSIETLVATVMPSSARAGG
jgi:nucleoside-diphosphate-sugar epimerase